MKIKKQTMASIIDLTGKKFGKLTVISLHRKGKTIKWKCLCACGNQCIVYPQPLKEGATKSCGCYQKIRASEAHTTHGFSAANKRLYGIWVNMRSRCLNLKDQAFKNYGGRGITVCDEWKNDPTLFIQWALNNGYTPNLTIDREDNNGNYTPENCRWISRKSQLQNTSRTLGIKKVIEIKRLLNDGIRPRVISLKYHVDRSCIYKIKTNKRYSNIII